MGYLGSDWPQPLDLHHCSSEQNQLVIQSWRIISALCLYLRLDPGLQLPELVTGQEHDGEQDSVGAGLCPRPEHVSLEKVHLSSCEASNLFSSLLDLLQIIISKTFGRISIGKMFFSLLGELLVLLKLDFLCVPEIGYQQT